MKNTILLAVVVTLLGCGKKAPHPEPDAKTEPKAVAKKPATIEPTPEEMAALEQKHPNAFVNSLGMVFKPVSGTGLQFCIWETRVKDYAAYVSANAGVNMRWKAPFGDKFNQEETHPVVNVNWNDAQAFCAWLTKKELAAGKIKQGQEYRLPTDAEWSVAVGLDKEKGNTPAEKDERIKDVYPWGEEWPPPKRAGNYDGPDDFKYTAAVGSFAANKFGLHDLGGNAWEWCEDFYNPANKRKRVLRGTSWYNGAPPGSLLSSFRGNSTADMRGTDFGFRCVLASE